LCAAPEAAIEAALEAALEAAKEIKEFIQMLMRRARAMLGKQEMKKIKEEETLGFNNQDSNPKSSNNRLIAVSNIKDTNKVIPDFKIKASLTEVLEAVSNLKVHNVQALETLNHLAQKPEDLKTTFKKKTKTYHSRLIQTTKKAQKIGLNMTLKKSLMTFSIKLR
jgi:type I site-specific restriction endonuclease